MSNNIIEIVIIPYEKSFLTMHIHPNNEDYVSRRIKQTKTFYEKGLLDFIKENFPVQKNIVDIGANIGNHSLFFSTYMKCNHIYAFEPFEKNVKLFKENLKKFQNHTLYKSALSDVNADRILL